MKVIVVCRKLNKTWYPSAVVVVPQEILERPSAPNAIAGFGTKTLEAHKAEFVKSFGEFKVAEWRYTVMDATQP